MKKVVLENDKSIEKVSRFAQNHGLAFSDKIEPDEDRPGEVIWASEGAADRLHRLDDQFCNLIYLICDGENESELCAAAAEELDGLTSETLVIALQAGDDAGVSRSSIAALGVLAPPTPQESYLAIFRRLLHHEQASVREAAISATGYAGWPDLVTELEAVAAKDPEPALRDYARIAIDAISNAEREDPKP